VGHLLVGALCFSLVGLSIKLAGQHASVFQIAFVRSLLGGIWCCYLVRREPGVLLGVNRPLLIFRGVIGCAAMLTTFWVVTRIPLADATVLFFINPVFVAVLAAIFLGERIGRAGAGFIGLCVLGVVLVAKPAFLFGEATLDELAVLAALAGAFCAGLAYVSVRAMRATEHPLAMVFSLNFFSVLGTAPFLGEHWVWGDGLGAAGVEMWAALLAVAIFAQGGQFFMTVGLKEAEAGRGAAVGYVQIVLAILWGMLFFDEFPDVPALVGALLIVAGAYGLNRRRAVPTARPEA
jgi:drug/metabolite transporter (DMT)-like permease